jgi:hypothetical protein
MRMKCTQNIHVHKTCLKNPKKYTHVALQQLCGILHIINPLLGETLCLILLSKPSSLKN